MRVTRWSLLSADRCRALGSAAQLTSWKSPPSLLPSDKCDGTVFDSRMGPRFEGDVCGTCGGTPRTCALGHHGVLELGTHVLAGVYAPRVCAALGSLCTRCWKRASPSECELGGGRCTRVKSVKDAKNGYLTVDGESWTAAKAHEKLAGSGLPNEPQNMIFENVLVLSNAARPVHSARDARRTVLRTHRFNDAYQKLARLAARFREARDVERRFLNSDLYEALNELLMSAKSGRPGTTRGAAVEEDVCGVLAGIKSKRGLIRNNLMGKRVDFSARAVAAGDPTLRVDEFGVPSAWRSKLTVPVRAFPANIGEMRRLVRYGDWMTILKRESGAQYDSDTVPARMRAKLADGLELGDVVERYLCDGDPIVLIRQPTLHAGSMMCGKVRLHDRHTLEMNVNVTTPYNGDFDGDEFNAFVPRSETARAEYLELFAVRNHVVDENGRCQIYPIQNAVLGQFRGFGRTGAECRRLVADAWFQRGGDAAVDEIQRLSDEGNAWLERHGASVGLNEFDCVRLDPIRASDGALLREEKRRALEVARALEGAQTESAESLAFNEAAKFVAGLEPMDCALRDMARSGCKGGPTNELNVALALGRQFVCDAAPAPFFGTHILPCGVKSGFIPVGYVRGLRPEHTALHQMSGRYGVYTKSVGVRASGLRYREMSQRMESLVVGPTGVVLDEAGCAVQLLYGEDGLSPKFARLGGERARVEYGCAVGVIAAQSISEPATQELLNKIHSGERNQKKSHLNALFKPGCGGEEIRGRRTDEAQPPVIPLTWSVTRTRPEDCAWTRFYESFDASFPEAEAAGARGAYLVLEFDRGADDILSALRRLPNRRSQHPSMVVDSAVVKVHAAFASETEARAALAELRVGGLDWVRVEGEDSVSCGGGSLRSVLAQPWIRDAYSFDAREVASVLGIEAARAMLMREFTAAFGGKVDPRHVMLMVDCMTYTGEVLKMDYTGLRRGSSVLGRACCSDPVKEFISAASSGVVEGDTLNASEAVVMSSACGVGTGAVRLVLDANALVASCEGDVVTQILGPSHPFSSLLAPFADHPFVAISPTAQEEYDPEAPYHTPGEGGEYVPSEEYDPESWTYSPKRARVAESSSQ